MRWFEWKSSVNLLANRSCSHLGLLRLRDAVTDARRGRRRPSPPLLMAATDNVASPASVTVLASEPSSDGFFDRKIASASKAIPYPGIIAPCRQTRWRDRPPWSSERAAFLQAASREA